MLESWVVGLYLSGPYLSGLAGLRGWGFGQAGSTFRALTFRALAGSMGKGLGRRTRGPMWVGSHTWAGPQGFSHVEFPPWEGKNKRRGL